MIKTLKEKTFEQDFYYVVFSRIEEIVEFTDLEEALSFSRTTGGIFYDHLPYEEYGCEDPYTFVNTWILTNENGDIIEYSWVEDKLMEVIVTDYVD